MTGKGLIFDVAALAAIINVNIQFHVPHATHECCDVCLHAPRGRSMTKGGATPRNNQYQQKTRHLGAALHPAAIHASIGTDCHDTTTNELTLLAICKVFNTVE
jgi:hypothetical protein